MIMSQTKNNDARAARDETMRLAHSHLNDAAKAVYFTVPKDQERSELQAAIDLARRSLDKAEKYVHQMPCPHTERTTKGVCEFCNDIDDQFDGDPADHGTHYPPRALLCIGKAIMAEQMFYVIPHKGGIPWVETAAEVMARARGIDPDATIQMLSEAIEILSDRGIEVRPQEDES